VTEGLSAAHAGRELAHHAEPLPSAHPHRLISITEAAVLSIVTLVAAWSSYAAAKWTTESRIHFADASAKRTAASRAFQQSLTLRLGDATTFNAWFAAYLTGNPRAAQIAARRFRPEFRVAFDAWLATKPLTNPQAPPGPQSMAAYRPRGAAQSRSLDRAAEQAYADGEHAGEAGDDYIRATVILASVLFLVGISTHFTMRSVRLGLLGLGSALLIVSAVAILRLPVPP
jgi:hypothetical protein